MRRHPVLVYALVVLLVTAWLAAVVPRGSAKDVTFVVEERNVLMNPDVLAVARGDSVTVVVYNNDSFAHTFTISEFGIDLNLPGQSVNQVTFTADTAGTFWFVCLVPGHATQNPDGTWTGMAGRLIVNEPPPTPALETVLVLGAVVGLALLFRFRPRRQR